MDPFLLAHQIAESVFDIGGKLYPVSIRDQMVRGQSIIDRAVAGAEQQAQPTPEDPDRRPHNGVEMTRIFREPRYMR